MSIKSLQTPYIVSLHYTSSIITRAFSHIVKASHLHPNRGLWGEDLVLVLSLVVTVKHEAEGKEYDTRRDDGED